MVVYIAINTYLKKSNKTKYKSFTNISSFSFRSMYRIIPVVRHVRVYFLYRHSLKI